MLGAGAGGRSAGTLHQPAAAGNHYTCCSQTPSWFVQLKELMMQYIIATNHYFQNYQLKGQGMIPVHG
jgi:hypothetical protein